MNKMSIGKKIGAAFSVALFLFTVVASWSYLGIGKIVGNAREVIAGNHLRAEMLQREVDHLNWAGAVASVLTDESARELKVQMDPHKCKFGEWYYGDGRKKTESMLPGIKGILADIEEPHRKLHESASEMAGALQGEGGRKKALAVFGSQTRPNLSRVQELLRNVSETSKEKILSEQTLLSGAVNTQWVVAVLSMFAGAICIAIAFLIARSIASVSGKIIEEMTAGAAQISEASSQLSSSSQGMAEGSSEQAASLEETASAMEEMSAMTQRNTESAGQAKQLSDRLGANAERANASMGSMVGQMAQISSMGEAIGKIIKTIDEIAFQTNLLALNAAVEAARAGEAGAGFAVVADEVRNLAQRAAGAAKNTAELIEGTIRKIKDGTQLLERTNADFQEVSSGIRKITGLAGEIAAASKEQSRGIGEVSGAVSQMDKVTQGNAATAEEIAAASEELNAQAVAMQEIVRTLQTLVKGEGSAMAAASPAQGLPRAGVRAVAAKPKPKTERKAAFAPPPGGNGDARYSPGLNA